MPLGQKNQDIKQKQCCNTVNKNIKDSPQRTGTTQRDGVGREEGGGFRMGSVCIPVADSF